MKPEFSMNNKSIELKNLLPSTNLKQSNSIGMVNSNLNEKLNLSKLRSEENDYSLKYKHDTQQDVLSPKLQKNNKSLRFSKYSIRKEDSAKKKNWLPILTYQEPISLKEKGKGLDFAKMKDRNISESGSSHNVGNPSICYYQPNYDYILKSSPRAIKFDPKDDRKNTNKQYLIKKIWRSYEVSSDYKLVNLKSFVEDGNDIKKKQY